MNRKGLYIVLLLISIGFNEAFTQDSDSLHCDSNAYTIVLNCVPTINGDSLADGDEINVLSNITDVAWQRNTIKYLADSLNIIPLEGTLTVDSSPNNADLDFSIYSFSDNCMSNKVDFTTDDMNSSQCILYVNSFKAYNHIVELPPDSICTGNEPIALYSDIPDNKYTLTANSADLKINEKGEIVPRESLPGRHIVNVSSNYCLSNNKIEVVIFASPELSLEDTLSICRGNSFGESISAFSDFQFYGTDNSETYAAVDISEGGDYIAVLAEGPCASVDTVFVNLIDPPEIDYTTQDLCDRVIVRMNIPVERTYSVNWSNDVEGLENTIFNDTMLIVDLVNEDGCVARESIEIKVNPLTLNSVDYKKEEADCWTDGQLIIETIEVDNYDRGYEYQLYNKLTNQILSDLDEVPEGVYSLRVVDGRGCVAEYEQVVKVEQKCLEDYPAFSPDGDNIEDSYFIPHEGTVSIYNRNGVLLKELETPAYWDGTDSKNNTLPMGNYLLITDTGRPVNITIIR